MVHDDVASVIFPLHLSDKFVTRSRSGLADGENEDCADQPDNQPDTGKEIREDWQKIDPKIIHHVLCCSLVDCDSDTNSIPTAAHAAEVKSGNAPNDIGAVLDPFAIVALLWILLMLHVSISTATD